MSGRPTDGLSPEHARRAILLAFEVEALGRLNSMQRRRALDELIGRAAALVDDVADAAPRPGPVLVPLPGGGEGGSAACPRLEVHVGGRAAAAHHEEEGGPGAA